jgi:ParB family chromosome partitioning protein
MSATQLLPLTEIHLDSGTQTRVYTSEDAVADYAERLLEGDEFPPIEVFFDGKEYHCADGFHRYMANMRNGAKKILANIHPGTAQDAIWFAIGANRANGIKRTKGDKQNAIAIALAKFPDKTQAEIAKHVGCSVGWVNKVKSEIHTEIRPPATRVNSRGETRPTTYAKAATPPAVPAEVPTPPVSQDAPEAEPLRVHVHVSHNSGENEWYTPAPFIAAAREVMGEIDCDPASSDIANKTVQATTYFDKERDGLKQEWRGNVWMNPPYAQPLMSQFAEAVASKFESGEIHQAIVLVNNATETAWFQRMAGVASAICFPASRIKFIDQNGKASCDPLQGQAVLYLGVNKGSFDISFSEFGNVLFSRDL